ncbi:inositol monophosphatase [Photobacterium profundum]|uniref:Inositol-1-monophosphatase n=1 Tax=Photobacterium profundum 3TCK TaxID=314280 RepID=Q1ZBA9_9GAMM|nr:inositol monophosphatase family protein [Photobacterium profundum]EAS45233.1 myo-inositol-1-monophosphotase [Photobacterium profundum 3TCK]PSV63565.1 inositol monophosphatase [Photobacterium profundum]
MNNKLRQKYAFAKLLAKEAGTLALNFQAQLQQGKLTVSQKGRQDFVSEADKETENFIKNCIATTYPEDGFLGEETGQEEHKKGQGVWVVDPIDGTTNYLRQHSLWCISIAYMIDDKPIIGVIYDPTHDELFSALEGSGAWLNEQAMYVNQGIQDIVSIVNVGYSAKMPLDAYLQTITRLLDHGIEHRRHGSAALGLAHVAAGRFDGYREDFLNTWDIMAGVIILQESGANVDIEQRKNGYAIQASIPAITAILKG